MKTSVHFNTTIINILGEHHFRLDRLHGVVRQRLMTIERYDRYLSQPQWQEIGRCGFASLSELRS